MNLQKQLRCVYLHAFFSTLRFTDAVWVALLAARGFSLAEIGLAEGVFHLTSLLCEVPSGMAADLLGRRRTLIFGGVLGVFSALAMASAPGLGLICTAMALKALGYNMLSGTAEALIYDSLKMAGREKDYIKVDANASICMKIATALGSLASLLAGVLRYAGYYLADAVSALLSALAAARLEEPIVTDEQAARERHTLRELPARLRVHILDSADCLRGSALARRLIAADAVISLPSYLTSMFVQQRLTEQGGGHGMAVPAGVAGRSCRYGGHGTGAAAAPQDPARPVFSLCADHWRGGTAGRGGPGVGLCRRADAGAGGTGCVVLAQYAADERVNFQRPPRDAYQRGQHDVQFADDPGKPDAGLAGGCCRVRRGRAVSAGGNGGSQRSCSRGQNTV